MSNPSLEIAVNCDPHRPLRESTRPAELCRAMLSCTQSLAKGLLLPHSRKLQPEARPTHKGIFHKALREPLMHFLAAGLLLFAASEIHRRHIDTYRIVITPQREAQLARRYALQYGAQPDGATLEQLVERDIEEEILFRRGLALELDRDDEIVRRRIVQKMQFLLQDLSAPAEPDDAELAAYYKAHAQQYITPARVTFGHIYFSSNGDDEQARARALQALEELSKDGARAGLLGDPFPDLYYFSAYETEQVRRLFGHTEFSKAVFSAPLKAWAGPYRSSYGWHLIRVDARHEARRQELTEVRDQVRTDYLLDAQTRTNAAALDDLAREFSVARTKS
jgi:peptidyl-prolyl cis-trans isomerase C